MAGSTGVAGRGDDGAAAVVHEVTVGARSGRHDGHDCHSTLPEKFKVN